jgi:CIC family chloride channel protein
MIAAATGALVSVIALDETILLNLNNNKILITIKSLYVLLGILTGLFLFTILNFRRTEHFFQRLKLNPYKKHCWVLVAVVNFVLLRFVDESMLV